MEPEALAELAGRYRLPHDYFIPDAILTLVARGDHLDARWQDGGVNTVYPLGPDRYLDRNYWAELRFTRDSAGRVTGFGYRLLQGFVARRIQP